MGNDPGDAASWRVTDEKTRLRRLPLRGGVLGHRQLCDVGAGVLQRDKLASARQGDRIVERPVPALGRATRRDQRPPG
jgi:hypothetical protein